MNVLIGGEGKVWEPLGKRVFTHIQTHTQIQKLFVFRVENNIFFPLWIISARLSNAKVLASVLVVFFVSPWLPLKVASKGRI